MGAADIVNLFVIMAGGVIIADMISSKNVEGTKALFKNTSNIWATSVKGMLGQTS